MSGSSGLIFCISLLGKRVLVFVVLKRNPSKGGEMFRRFSRFKLESKKSFSSINVNYFTAVVNVESVRSSDK